MRSMKSYKFLVPVLFVLLLACTSPLVVAQTFNVLYTFHGTDGGAPDTQLTLDKAGDIYGTTAAGGTGICNEAGCGTVFAINKSGKLLSSFSFNGNDGWGPVAGVFRDSAGNLWGTTSDGGRYTQACGGSNGLGCGVLFKLTPQGKETAYKAGGAPGPWGPDALLVADGAGDLYGTSFWGGTHHNGGTAYKLDPVTGKGTLLYDFPSGANPGAGMILLNGNFYGTMTSGGVYQMTPTGQVTTIAGVGGSPDDVLAADSAGNLYGTTQYGGSNNCGLGCGTVFKLSPTGDGRWIKTTLYVFCQISPCDDGELPYRGPLAIDSAGNIYGTTLFGGTSQNCNGTCGVVFKIDPNGNETVIHNFTDGADGALPAGGLTMDSAGNLYGAAAEGGDPTCPVDYPYGCGVVYEITP